MSEPPPPPTDDAPLPPGGVAPSASQMQSIHRSGASAGSGKGKLIGIIAGGLIVAGGLIFAGITLWAKFMGGGDLSTPDGTVKYVLNELANNKPEVLWEAMPASHKQTLNDELKKSMANVDMEIHAQSIAVLQKFSGILKNKKTLIIEAANNASQQGDGPPGEGLPPEVAENWDNVVGILDIMVGSKVSDADWVQNPDLGLLLKEDGGKLMSSPHLEKLLNMALAEKGGPNAPKDMTELRSWVKGIKVIVVSQTDTTATLKLRSEEIDPEDPETLEFNMVKVEDRWLPEEMAVDLEKELKKLKQVVPGGAVADTKMTEQQKEVTLNFLKTVDGVLDAIDKQETAENLMLTAMGGMGGLALQFGQLQSAFPNIGIAGGPGGLPGGNPGSFPGGNAGGFPGGNAGSFPGGNAGGFPGGNTGLPAAPALPFGKRQRWTINGGKPDKRIDQIYLNKPAATIETVFGMPDSKEGAYWIYKGMTVRNIGGGGTMKTVYFGIQNGVVVDIQARQ